MPPPPPPYVAPDLRPIVARDAAQLTFTRDAMGRMRGVVLSHGLWIAAEGAPLEVRFHRRANGTVWAEQASYPAGERGTGTARASASAHVQVVSARMTGGMGTLRNLVRYTVRDANGTAVRSWTAGHCGTAENAARLDRVGSPDEPTYPSSWEGCSGFSGAYVLGRMVGLDRGWAMPAPSEVTGVNPLPAGTYRLELQIDPLQGLADADRSNDVTSVRLEVRHGRSFGQGEGADGDDPFVKPKPAPVTLGRGSGPLRAEPEWVGDRARAVERRAAQVRKARTGREDGAGTHPAPPVDVDLPDLRSAPSYGISTRTIRRQGTGARRDQLLFGALTWNAGPGRLEVEAFRETGELLHAFQVFFRDGERVARQQRGTMVWHAAPGHDHFHFDSFARYQLTRMDGRVVLDAGKHSWCIVDTDMVDTTRPGVLGGSPISLSGSTGACGSDPGSLWARQSLSVGSGDYYAPGIAGQSFDITNLPNGLYRIRLEANPSGVIAEADHTNNVSTRVVRLSGRRGARTVTARPVATVDERAAFSEECTVCT